MTSKVVVLCLGLVVSSGLGFSEAHFQLGMGFLYLDFQTPTESKGDDDLALRGFLSCRVGCTADLLFTLGPRAELGAEFGLYGMPMSLIFAEVTMLEIPVDVLFRVNLNPARSLAFELRCGLWTSSYTITSTWGGSENISDSRFHAGGRLVIEHFYLGVDYVMQSQFHPAIGFEAGGKWTL